MDEVSVQVWSNLLRRLAAASPSSSPSSLWLLDSGAKVSQRKDGSSAKTEVAASAADVAIDQQRQQRQHGQESEHGQEQEHGVSMAATNLLREVAARGIAQERVVFGARVDRSDHLRRADLADLQLDSLHISAHSTAVRPACALHFADNSTQTAPLH
jgi:hypothetical protein